MDEASHPAFRATPDPGVSSANPAPTAAVLQPLDRQIGWLRFNRFTCRLVRFRVWNNRSNRFGWSSYLGQSPGGSVPPYAVPARREDLSGLPPTWLGVGTADLFLDEDRAYAQRLREAGVELRYLEVEGGIHGLDHSDTEMARAFEASMVDFVRRFVG